MSAIRWAGSERRTSEFTLESGGDRGRSAKVLAQRRRGVLDGLEVLGETGQEVVARGVRML